MLLGIVGKPSTGKSTFFKAATLAEVDIAPYPFTTIKPNSAIGYVRTTCASKFFNTFSTPREGYVIGHNRFVPIQMIDVAGLVPGAHEGKGLGNQFLTDLSQADALVHIIDISGSTNEKGENVEPLSYDPLNDVKFLEEEIDLWFKSIMTKNWGRFVRQVVGEKTDIAKAIHKQFSGLKIIEDYVNKAIVKLNLNKEQPDKWTDSNLQALCAELRHYSKPMIIAANKCDVPGSEKNIERLKKSFPDYVVIPCSADSELALRQAAKHGLIKYVPGDSTFEALPSLNPSQKLALEAIRKNVLDKFGNTGVQQVLDHAIFRMLNYITIYPGGLNNLKDSEGRVLPDCFLMRKGSTALDFAFRLHTDFGKTFIRAINVKTKRTVGKEYVLEDGDVIEIISAK
ncbi:MAG TPA: redox-regulated ATPase YchF [Candidatus Nanoarchaeia archaeon]|nr:redox-regulated ATPase YchF [Candidatus Nanoarchaeia archaeon]